MNIKERTYSSILSLVKNDIYFPNKILRRTEKTHIVIYLSRSEIVYVYYDVLTLLGVSESSIVLNMQKML